VAALTAAGGAVVADDAAVDRYDRPTCTVRQVLRTTTEASCAAPQRCCPDPVLTVL